MGDKEGFEGEYDFLNSDDSDDDDDYDELEEELNEEDIDDEEHERRDLLSKREQELADQQTAFIENQGYIERFPNISLSDIVNGSYITFISESKGKSKILSEENLELWTKGKLKLDKDIEDLVRKWYPSGTYRVFKQLEHLQQRYNIETNPEKLLKLKKDIDHFFFEKMPSAKKFELSEAYGAYGERLTKLYLSIYGRTDEKRIDFGFFKAFVPVLFYKDEMKLKSRENPNFYFKDFKETYDFLYSLKGEPVVGTLTDEIFEDTGGTAQGELVLKIGEKWININSIIIRKEWMNERECSSIVAPIKLSRKNFLIWLKEKHPEFETTITNDRTVLFYHGNEIYGEYYMEPDGCVLELYAPVELQEKIIKGVLEYSTGNDLSDKGL
ncbi:MAG: hypothetical protein AABX39_01340 [Nanoarchaeota archaeon]